jgi:hypothetical protein
MAMLPKHPWLKKCLERLEKLPQIRATATTEPYAYENILADGKLTIQTQERQNTYIFTIRNGITAETLDLHLDYFSIFRDRLDSSFRPLLIVNDLSDFVVEQLFDKNIEFLDTNGTIYLNNKDCYILVRNSITQFSKKKLPYNLTASNLKLIYTFLQEPHRLIELTPEKLKQWAEVTGIDTRTVERSLEKLCELNYLRQRPKNSYQIVDYTKLLERWEVGYIETLRPSLLINTFRVLQGNFLEYSDKIVRVASLNNALIGGELGAALATQYIRPSSAVLHLPENQDYRELMVKLRLVPHLQGNITFLRQFGSRNKWWTYEKRMFYEQRLIGNPLLADPLLIHAELIINPDDRLKKTAQMLYEISLLKRQARAETFLKNN